MKKVFLILSIAAVALTGACNNDDDDSPAPVVNAPVNPVVTGTWRVTQYLEDGTDHTSDFSGYNFTFAASGVLTATNGTNTYSGAWSITHDDSSPDDFNIAFSSPSSFSSLTEDWSVLESTATRLRLQHTSGGDGSIDLLIFEKN